MEFPIKRDETSRYQDQWVNFDQRGYPVEGPCPTATPTHTSTPTHPPTFSTPTPTATNTATPTMPPTSAATPITTVPEPTVVPPPLPPVERDEDFRTTPGTSGIGLG
jgi:hypothetical protein